MTIILLFPDVPEFVVDRFPLRLLRRVVATQAPGLVAGFAGQVGHHRAGSGLRVGAAAGLRLFAHFSPPENAWLLGALH